MEEGCSPRRPQRLRQAPHLHESQCTGNRTETVRISIPGIRAKQTTLRERKVRPLRLTSPPIRGGGAEEEAEAERRGA